MGTIIQACYQFMLLMKRIFVFFIAILAGGILCQAQTPTPTPIQYTYDNAGNRITREPVTLISAVLEIPENPFITVRWLNGEEIVQTVATVYILPDSQTDGWNTIIEWMEKEEGRRRIIHKQKQSDYEENI